MMRNAIVAAAVAALILLLPTASAHPHATVVTVNGERCYLVTDGFATLNGRAEPQYWIESNGDLSGGDARGAVSEDAGLPFAGVPYWDLVGEFVLGVLGLEPGDVDETFEDGASGLQRTPSPWGAADTRVTAAAWAQRCLG